MRRARVTGQAAVNQAVLDLIDKFDYPDIDTQGPGGGAVGGGGMFTYAIAASDASEISKGKADDVCLGVDDHDTIMAGMAIVHAAGGGRLILSEGNYYCDPDQIIVGYDDKDPEPIIMQGVGDATVIVFGSAVSSYGIYVLTDCKIDDFAIQGFESGGT